MVNYESIYQGANDSLAPNYSPKIYDVDIGTTSLTNLGSALDARTANQLGELRTKINPGQKVIEIGTVGADAWESIPNQHIDEMRRVTKLAGVKPSLHAPIIEASGFTKEGWNETTRESAERQLQSTVMRGQKLDPDGNISVTVHSTAALPEMEPVSISKDKDGKRIVKPTTMWVVNPDTGKYGQIQPEKRHFPDTGKFEPKKEKLFDTEKELEKFNRDAWTKQLSDINRFSEYGENALRNVFQRNQNGKYLDPKAMEEIKEVMRDAEAINKPKSDGTPRFTEEQKMSMENKIKQINHGRFYLLDSYQQVKSLFDHAWTGVKKGGEDERRLREFANFAAEKVKGDIEHDPQKIEDLKDVVERGLKLFGQLKKTPETFQPLKKFVIDKSSETFANVATNAYKKFQEKTPIINIENPPAGGGLSKAEDIVELVKKSRKKLTQNLVKEGLNQNEAKKQSEKLIGATWDVGHINMLRKEGYSEKDIIKQAEIVAPYVKHVHLSDNFGFEHTELPMGMGNVPMKEIMKKLGEKGFAGKKIIEAGNWWQHFAEQGGGNPFKPTIEAFDSPIYAMEGGPSWGQPAGITSYYSGHGPVNTPIHHSVYGAGFTTLPSDLGGEIPGGNQSRFSGTPMQ
jgi:hypothetical protein